MLTRTKVATALSKHILHVLVIFLVVGVYSFDDDPPDPVSPQPGNDEQILDMVKKSKRRRKRVMRDALPVVLDADLQAPIPHDRKRKGRSMSK